MSSSEHFSSKIRTAHLMCIVCRTNIYALLWVSLSLCPQTKQPIEEHYHSFAHPSERKRNRTWQLGNIHLAFEPTSFFLRLLTQISELQTRIECWWCLVSGTEPHIPRFLASIVRRKLNATWSAQAGQSTPKKPSSLPTYPHTCYHVFIYALTPMRYLHM